MRVLRLFELALFIFWTVVALRMLAAVVGQPSDGVAWALLAIATGGATLYFPLRVTARFRQKLIVERPIDDVFQFLGQPANQHIWNPRVGISEPPVVALKVGESWMFARSRGWIPGGLMRQSFSEVDPPSYLEITTSGYGMHVTYAFGLRDIGHGTEVSFLATMDGIRAGEAWLLSAIAKVYPSRDFARLKRALES